MERLKAPPLEWAVASRPHQSFEESGDAFLVRELPSAVLLVTVDGLGHGPAAADAARRALRAVDAGDGDLKAVLERCHQALRGTGGRGVVIELARFDTARNLLAVLGIGSIQGVLLCADPAVRPRMLLRRGGVVGRRIPSPRIEEMAVGPGDTLVVATDGIRPTFTLGIEADGPVQSLADRILEDHWNEIDDALVLVARYKGTVE